MKNLTFTFFLLFISETVFSQTPFVVTNMLGERVGDTEIYRGKKLAGKTEAMGNITLKGVVKGETILFRHPFTHEEFIYTATSDNPKTVQEIKLVPPHIEEPKEKDLGSPYQSTIPPSPPQIPETYIYSSVEVPAEFPGGLQALLTWIDTNLAYPETAKEKKIEGKCYLRFIVSKEGNINDVQLQKGIKDCPECGAEAKRLVKSMPKWIPAKDKGNVVNSYYTLPIQFKLKP